MWSLYLLPTLRHIQKNRGSALINVVGLAFGLATFALIFSFVAHETSYDKFLPGVERLYRLEGTYNFPGREAVPVGTFFGPSSEVLLQDYPEIEAVTRLDDRPGSVLRDGAYFMETLMYTDANFFEVMGFPLLEGERATALGGLTGIALSRDMAVKYLGEGPWLGRSITINDMFEREHTVTAVFENIPDNSHFDLDILLPLNERVYGGPSASTPLSSWRFLSHMIYFRLDEAADIGSIEKTIEEFVDRHVPSTLTDAMGKFGSQVYTPTIHPLQAIHLESTGQYQMKPPGSWAVIYGFTAIGILVLLVACINYMNLATAQATTRAREIAIRKVNGAGPRQLFIQHQLEAVTLVLGGGLIGSAIARLALPLFQNYAGRDIQLLMPDGPIEALALLLLLIAIGLFAGAYPASVLSRVRPLNALSSSTSASSSVSRLRNALVVFQFTVSAALIIGAALIYIQTNFARTVDLGFDRSDKISLLGLGRAGSNETRETFKRRVLELPGVNGAALASFTPGERDHSAMQVNVPGAPDPILIFYRSIDWDFMDLYGVKPMAGRLFDRDHVADRIVTPEEPATVENPLLVNLVINLSAARVLGYKQPADAIGKTLRVSGGGTAVNTIVGVIPDVHFKTLRRPLIPEIYLYQPDRMGTLSISYEPAELTSLVRQIDRLWKEMFPRIPQDQLYVDEYMVEQFLFEEVQGKLLTIFSGLAILIASIGLFGLSAFAAERRTREIGIRKVLGAGRLDIIRLMLKQFAAPILIANIIAWPLSWYAINDWVASFHYRINMPSNFAIAAILAIITTVAIAWATVGTHAIRVSRANPADALRYE